VLLEQQVKAHHLKPQVQVVPQVQQVLLVQVEQLKQLVQVQHHKPQEQAVHQAQMVVLVQQVLLV
jgi:hypothetical protein